MQSNILDITEDPGEDDAPVSDPRALGHPEFIDYRARDLAMWHTWNQTKSKKDLGKLVQQLSPIIYKEVSRAAGTLPTTALNAEAKKWTVKAIHTYDPSKGFALSTHVASHLRKVRRMNYKYQNAVRLPENMQLQYHEYNKALNQLADELNKEPSEEEMAERLGWSKGQVVKFKNSLYADLMEGATDRPADFATHSDRSLLMKLLLEKLTDEEKFILQHKGSMSATELANKLNTNLNGLNYKNKKLTEKVAKLQKELGIH